MSGIEKRFFNEKEMDTLVNVGVLGVKVPKGMDPERFRETVTTAAQNEAEAGAIIESLPQNASGHIILRNKVVAV